jgi:MFS family permease
VSESIAVQLPQVAPQTAVRRILVGNLVSLIGDGMLLPFAALYFVREHDFRPAQAALVLALMLGSGVVLTAPGGALLDRLGVRRATILATLVQGIACIALGFAATVPAALAAALLYGAGRAVARPGVDAVVSDLTEGTDRTRTFAWLHMATNIGIGAGAALGGAIATFGGSGLRMLFVANAVSYFLFALVLQGAPDVAAHARQASNGGYRAVLSDRRFLRVLAIGFAGFVSLTQLDVSFPLYTVSTVGLSVGIVGVAALANTIAVIAFQAPIVRVTGGFPRSRVLALGAAGLAACWSFAALASVLPGTVLPAAALIAALASMGLAETLFIPIVFTLANELAPAELRGRYNGALWAVGGAAFAAGPLTGGTLVGAHLASVWLALLLVAAAAVAVLARRVDLRHDLDTKDQPHRHCGRS